MRKETEKTIIARLSNQHLINRINYLEQKQEEQPDRQTYIGDSDYAEQAVEAENRHNEFLANKIEKYIKLLKQEAKKRGLITF